MPKGNKASSSPDKEKKPTSKKGDKLQEINTDTLCDENWKCDIVLFYEGDKEGCDFMNILLQIPAKQIASGIKVVNKSDLLKELKKGGSKSKKSTKEKSQKGTAEDAELSDEQVILKCLKENTPIPGKPLACILKKYLIKIKLGDIVDRAKTAALKEKKAKPKSKENKKKDKQATNVVESSELPIAEIPPLFIILLGFSEHSLPLEMIKQDIPICAVVKIIKREVVPDSTQHEESMNYTLKDFGSSKFNMTWLKFWNKYDYTTSLPENADTCNDLATIIYGIPGELVGSKVNLKDKKNNVTSELTKVMNYIRNILEKYKLYAKSLKIIEISEPATDEYPDLYDTLIQMVPLECVSIPLMLFSLVEQISFWNGEDIEIESISECMSGSTSDGSNKRRKLKSSFKAKLKEPDRYSAIIRHNDENALRTFHLALPEINFNNVLVRFLSKSFLLRPILGNKPDGMHKYFLEFHLQRLWKITYRDIHLNLFYIYLHWFIFCKMKSNYKWKLRKTEKEENGVIINSDGLFFNKFYNDTLFHEWINEIKTDEEETFRSVYGAGSDVTGRQSLKKSNYFATGNENSVVNEHGDNHIFSSNVDSSRPDDTTSGDRANDCATSKSQTFIDYKTVDFIEKERNRNLLILKKFLYCNEILCLCDNEKPSSISICLKPFTSYKFIEEMTPVCLLQVLQESILKYSQIFSVYYYPSNKILIWFRNSKNYIFEEHKSAEINTVLGFRDYYSNVYVPEERALLKPSKSSTEAELEKSVDQNKSPEIGSSIRNVLNDGVSSTTGKNEDSCVYNLGKRMIKFDQHTSRFFSHDGSSVTVNIEDWYRSSQFFNVCISKINTELNIYVDKLSLDEDYENYTPVNGVPIETMKVLLKLPNETLLTVRVKEITELINEEGDIRAKFIYNDLTISMPSGLTIELVKNKYSNNDIYVKQSYSAKGPNCNRIWDENCRCFDNSGTIFVFKNDNTVDVIYPSTAVAKINNITESVIKPTEEVIENIILKDEKKEKTKKEKKNKQKPEIDVEEIKENRQEDTVRMPYTIADNCLKSWSGVSYRFINGACVENTFNQVNLRTIFSPSDRLYIDRNDGIKCLFTDDGRLISTHGDGTVLTTYVYEELDLIDFSEPSTERAEEYSTRGSIYWQEAETSDTISYGTYDKTLYPIVNLNEFYVSYKMGCIASHPNYANVEFSPKNDSIVLELPEKVIVTVSNIQSDGSYDFLVNINKKTVVKFSSQSINFVCNIIKKSKTSNITTISPIYTTNKIYDEQLYFCKTVDSFNRLFLIEKHGEVKLVEPQLTNEDGNDETSYTTKEMDFYYDHRVPKRETERFFVVNDNLSGYEFIKKSDISLLDKDDENRFKNVEITKSPTKNRINSKTSQYRVYATHSDNYMLKTYERFADIIPSSFQRADLSLTWTPDKSPWLFTHSDVKKLGHRQFSYSNISRHTDRRIRAIVVKTVQQVADTDIFNGLDIILNCLNKYKSENEKLCTKYREQGFTNCDVDLRLSENHKLLRLIRKEFPLWNLPRKECTICKQSFGFPTKRSENQNNAASKEQCLKPGKVEKVVNKISY